MNGVNSSTMNFKDACDDGLSGEVWNGEWVNGVKSLSLTLPSVCISRNRIEDRASNQQCQE
jgi:hypothetical protein